jgi:hypothetical protein
MGLGGFVYLRNPGVGFRGGKHSHSVLFAASFT